jgi:DDE superfamily endonuclease
MAQLAMPNCRETDGFGRSHSLSFDHRLVRLPPYAPELNPIENVWEYLRGNKLAITVFDDYDDIVPAMHGTSSNMIQRASHQSPPEHGRQSAIRAAGIRSLQLKLASMSVAETMSGFRVDDFNDRNIYPGGWTKDLAPYVAQHLRHWAYGGGQFGPVRARIAAKSLSRQRGSRVCFGLVLLAWISDTKK